MADESLQPLPLTIERALILLERGTITRTHGLMPWGSNYTFVLGIRDDSAEALVVYKPRAGERPLWDFPEGTLCLRERAAFLVSEALDWRFVPPTVLREGPEGFGSLQLFIPHDPEQHYFTFGPELRPQLRRIALFDHLVNNADRKGGHCLLDESGNLWAIDHGVCFAAAPKLRTVIWDFAGEKIPRALRDDLRRLHAALKGGELAEELSALLSEREIEALRRRAIHLAERAAFPEPGPGRSFPWPPV
jgi:uncharacterized repeat protein (TIGR03843 family)